MRKVYSLFAVILPVALGLGLEYLYIMDRLPGGAVFGVIAFMSLIMVGVPILVRTLRDERLEQDRYESPDLLR